MIETQTENITYSLMNPIVIIDVIDPTSDDIFCLSRENTIRAMCSLSPLAFFFYMFFVISEPQVSNPFLGTEFCEETDLPREIFIDAFDELMENHYLIPTETDPLVFYFNTSPDIPLDIQHSI